MSPDTDYDKLLSLRPQARLDLHWVVENICKFIGNFFKEPKVDIYIESDASLTGWGALCDNQSASGTWSPGELQYHINHLELLAAFHALQCYVSNLKSIHARLALDNSTAVAYINSMGVPNLLYWILCLDLYGNGVCQGTFTFLPNISLAKQMSKPILNQEKFIQNWSGPLMARFLTGLFLKPLSQR